MALLAALSERLNEALRPTPERHLTRRDAALPSIPGKAHAVIGMRRSGKSCFLKQLLAERRRVGPPERSMYLSFDDDRLAGIDASQLDALLEEYFRRYPEFRASGQSAWFLDEIQLVPGWERFVRRVLDSEPIDVVVSGSSAKMLSREVHTSLRGRAMATVITPFSFREVLRHHGEEPSVPADRLTAAERSAVEARLREYLVAGGFPEVNGPGVPGPNVPGVPGVPGPNVPRDSRIKLLQGYVDAVLLLDVIERYSVSQPGALRWIVRHALRNPCRPVSVHRLQRDLQSQGHRVGRDTVLAMLDHLTDAFLLSAVPVATESERRRNTNPRRVYPADPGLIEAFDTSGRSNTGHALETAVFNELARRGADVAYAKTADGFEVDFVARHPDGRQQLIQACADASDEETWDRETRALDAVHAEHPRAERVVVVLDVVSARQRSHPKTRIVPAHQWLLED
jgi:hypothetical protein